MLATFRCLGHPWNGLGFEGDYDLTAYVVFSKADYGYVDRTEPFARFFMHSKLADPSYGPEDFISSPPPVTAVRSRFVRRSRQNPNSR